MLKPTNNVLHECDWPSGKKVVSSKKGEALNMMAINHAVPSARNAWPLHMFRYIIDRSAHMYILIAELIMTQLLMFVHIAWHPI